MKKYGEFYVTIGFRKSMLHYKQNKNYFSATENAFEVKRFFIIRYWYARCMLPVLSREPVEMALHLH